MSKVIQLKDIVNLRRETLLPKDSNKKLNFVGLKHIDSGVSTLKRWGDASEVKSVKSRFYPNDVLYGKLRPYLDKAIIAEIEGICSSDILVLTANSKVMPRFLVYLLHSHTFRSYAVSTSSGITLPRTSWSTLGKFTFTLPPLPEQERIVTKLEVLFTQLDAAVDSLKKAQAQLQRYCRSILKAAFEGELTKEWRARHSDSWESMNLNEFITLESGSRPKGGVRGILEGIPSLGGEHLNADGGFNFEKIKYIPEAYFESLNKGRICPDDIIVVKDGATTGKTSFVDKDFPYQDAAVNEHLFIVRVDPKVAFPKYVFYYLFSNKGQQQVLSDFRGATVGGISRNFPLKVTVPIPSLTEQKQIVSEIERCLSIADRVEATIASELTRSERLRQSILKHAFSGKLVPQDPNDEPASVLLEEIQVEKEHQQPKRKKTTTRAKTQDGNNYPLLALAGALGQNDGSIDDESLAELRGDKSE
ncbi:MAG: restriction endonuclease subunit S [Candidatus Poribacteria bacterium]|nr:restriction endonuclease subunit S [Candidatus Poribacteria bacterium]